MSVSVKVKESVWKKYVGNTTETTCFCCGITNISCFSFDAGHVDSKHKGGSNDIENLRPICGSCNSSMKTENMYDFMLRMFPQRKSVIPIEHLNFIELKKKEVEIEKQRKLVKEDQKQLCIKRELLDAKNKEVESISEQMLLLIKNKTKISKEIDQLTDEINIITSRINSVSLIDLEEPITNKVKETKDDSFDMSTFDKNKVIDGSYTVQILKNILKEMGLNNEYTSKSLKRDLQRIILEKYN